MLGDVYVNLEVVIFVNKKLTKNGVEREKKKKKKKVLRASPTRRHNSVKRYFRIGFYVQPCAIPSAKMRGLNSAAPNLA